MSGAWRSNSEGLPNCLRLKLYKKRSQVSLLRVHESFGPSVQGGDSASDDGNWFGVTVSIPFDFYFIA